MAKIFSQHIQDLGTSNEGNEEILVAIEEVLRSELRRRGIYGVEGREVDIGRRGAERFEFGCPQCGTRVCRQRERHRQSNSEPAATRQRAPGARGGAIPREATIAKANRAWAVLIIALDLCATIVGVVIARPLRLWNGLAVD